MGISDKITIGFVVKNQKNQFLFRYAINNKVLDVSLLDSTVPTKGFDKEQINNIYFDHTGHNLSECGEIYTLDSGRDKDGMFKIFYIRVEWEDTKSGDYFWLSRQDVEKWYEEGRINTDQYLLIKKANKINFDTLTRKKIVKPKTRKDKPITTKDKSIIRRRLEAGRFIKPTDKSQVEVAEEIIKSGKHGSIKNFTNILNYEELLLDFAKISPNPLECSDYFYTFINDHLLDKRSFRVAFLRQVYLNENVYTRLDIEKIIEIYNLKKENAILLFDTDLKDQLKLRLANAQTFPKFDVKKYDSDKEYRREKDKLVELNKLKEAGLKEIVQKFEEIQKSLEKDDNY